jgi:PAS domain S-box-containing protein
MSAHSDLRFKTVWDTLENYKNIFYNLNIMVIVHDFDGNIREVNNKAALTFGYSEKEFLSINTDDIQTEEAQVTCRDIMEETRKHGTSHSQVSLVKKNGETFPACAYTNLLKIDNDQLVLCVIDDLTELKKVEKELRDNNIFFNSIIENIPDMIFLKDAEDLRFVRFNRAGEELLGHSKKDLIGKSDYDFFPTEEADFFTSKDREVLKSGKVLEIPEEEIHTREKGVRTLHTKKITVYDEDNLPKYLLGISEDITERKQLEEKFELVVESAPNAIIITDHDGVINLVNTQTESIFGYNRTELLGQPVEILIPERHRAAYRKDRKQFSKEPKPSRMGAGRELTGRHKDGSEFPVEINITPLSTKDGTIFLNSITDITHRKKREEWMRIRDRAINSSPFGILITGTIAEGNNIIQCNPAFEDITGYKLDEIIGKNCRFLQGDDQDQESIPRLREAIEEGKSFQGLLRNYKKDGTLFWNELTISPVRDETGTITHYVGIQNDVTERKKAEDALKKAHSELESKVMERTAELVELNNKLKSEIEIRKKVGDALRFNVEQLSKKKRYEEIINTVTRALHQSLELSEVLDNAVAAISTNVNEADSVSIYLVEGNDAVLQAQRGYSDRFVRKLSRIPSPRGVTWRTLTDGKLMYSPDTDNDEVIGPSGIELGTKSYVSVPIKYEGKTIGCMNIHSFDKNSFEQDEIDLLELIAAQIEIAIKNARQAESLKQNFEYISRKNRYEEITSTVTRAVHQSLNVNEVLESAVEVISNNVEKVNIVTTYLVEGDYAVVKTHRGLTNEYMRRAGRVPYPKGVVWHTIQTAERIYVPDIEKDKIIGDAGKTLPQKSYLAVPFLSGKTAVGAIFIASQETNAFDDEEIRLLETVSQQIGVAINNAKQAESLKENLEQLSRKNRYEEIISTVTRAVHQSLNLNEVLKSAVEVISKNVRNADLVTTYLVEDDFAALKSYSGTSREFIQKTSRIPRGKGATWHIILEGKCTHVPDVSKDKIIGKAGVQQGLKSYIGVPLFSSNTAVGVIFVASYEINSFDDDDLKLFKIVSQQISVAIDNARQAEALKENLEHISRINSYEEIISTVTSIVHQSLDLERVLENAMDVIINKMTSADTAAIYMVEGDYAVLKAHRNLTDEFISKAARIPRGKGIVWRTVLEGSPKYVPDLDKDQVIGNAGRKLGINSYAAVPFFSSNKAVGGIYIGSVNKNSFNQDEIRVFNTVSQQIGIAIDNARQAQALKESQEMLRISEEHYRLLVETTNVIPWEADAVTQQFTYVGPQAEKILGYPVEKWYEKDFWVDCIHAEDREYVVNAFESNSATKKEFEFEYRMIASDGGVSWLHDVVTVEFENGEPKTLRGFMVDITERKKAEYELQANLEQLSRKNRYEEIISTVTMAVHKSRNLVEVLENAVEIISRNIGVVDHVSIFLVDGDDAVMKASRGFPDWFLKKMLRIPKPRGFTWACINSGKVIYCPDAEKDSVIGPAGKKAGSMCYLSIPLKDGADPIGTINLHSLKKDAFDKDDISLLEMVGKQIEIAINKSRDAEALRNSEERYRAIVEHTYNMIIETDQFGIIRYANPRHKDLLGYDPEELIGTNCLDLVYEEDRPTVAAAFRHAVSTGESVETARYRCRHKNGELRWLESTGKPYESTPGVTRGIISSRDITERKKTEDSRREIMERHQALVEHAYDIIVETTSDGKFSYVNPTFTETLGYEQTEVLGKSIFEFVHPDDTAAVMAEFAQAVTKFTTGNIAYRLKNKQGEWLWLESSGRPFKTASGETRASITTRDITEKKRSEEELKKAFSEIEALKNQLEQENIYLQEEVKLIHRHGEIYGHSKALESALNLAEQVANTESTVLILGETGTGKELLAHAIHNMSPRKDRPMVIVNCTTLPASLVEDELFGHEKGSFTGASSRRAGRFEIADGSTIFLDEVGELPMELQSKLLRVLQTGQFERIGGTQTLSVNARVITATNRDLTRDVREGRFREDLFYRLNVFPISLPPLRERKEDIPLLVEAFVKEFGEKMGKSINKISKKTMNHLMSYSWPGNVRELRNVIERAVIISGGDNLNIDLPGAETTLKAKAKTLSDLEKDHIVKILNMTNWRIRGEGGAAQLLEMKPTTLESRMRRLGIERFKGEQH